MKIKFWDMVSQVLFFCGFFLLLTDSEEIKVFIIVKIVAVLLMILSQVVLWRFNRKLFKDLYYK